MSLDSTLQILLVLIQHSNGEPRAQALSARGFTSTGCFLYECGRAAAGNDRTADLNLRPRQETTHSRQRVASRQTEGQERRTRTTRTSSAAAHWRGIHRIVATHASNVGSTPSTSATSPSTPRTAAAWAPVAEGPLVLARLDVFCRGRLHRNGGQLRRHSSAERCTQQAGARVAVARGLEH